MPILQKLADEGVLFRNAWSTPVCAPSRAMMDDQQIPAAHRLLREPGRPRLLSADNGTAEIRGSNEVMDKNSYDCDNGIRVPLLASGGVVKPRGCSDVLVDFNDFWPIFAQLSGYRGPMNTDGHSFAPYLLGKPFNPRETIQMTMNNARWVSDKDWLVDGRGRVYDTYASANRDEYRDVSESAEPEVIAARQRFETYLKAIPLPDENDPATRRAWERFRSMPQGKPVDVFRPAYLE